MAFIPTIGQMRMVLKFENVIKATDETGGQYEEYTDFFTGRGYFREKRAFHTMETGADQTVTLYEAWVPWRQVLESEISTDLRVIYEARVFLIETFRLVDQKRRIYKFDLTEVRR